MLRSEHDGLMVAVLNTATLSERVRRFHCADAEDWQFAADVFNDTPIYDRHHLVSINVTEAELKAIIAGWQFDWENCDDDVANFVSDAQVTEINDALAKA